MPREDVLFGLSAREAARTAAASACVCLCVLQCVCFCVRGINELIHLEGRRCAHARVCNADVDMLPTSDVTLA